MDDQSAQTFIISRTEMEDFLSNIEQTLQNCSVEQIRHLKLYDDYYKTISISFDKFWKPFIGYTKGYNGRLDKRVYFMTPLPELITKIGKRMREIRDESIEGGRIIMRTKTVFYQDEVEGKNIIYNLIWPKKNILKTVNSICMKYREK